MNAGNHFHINFFTNYAKNTESEILIIKVDCII